MRVEPCACGGRISAPNLEGSAPAVAEHNRTKKHVLWRMAGGLEHLVETPPLVLFMESVVRGMQAEHEQRAGRKPWPRSA